jgi:hypothetical protein
MCLATPNVPSAAGTVTPHFLLLRLQDKNTLYTVGRRNDYISLANYDSCILAEFHWYRSKSTLRSKWLHQKMHFLHPPGCGHTQYTWRVRTHWIHSLANFISCLLANFHWSRSEEPSKSCGCITRCTFYILQDVGTLCLDHVWPFMAHGWPPLGFRWPPRGFRWPPNLLFQ